MAWITDETRSLAFDGWNAGSASDAEIELATRRSSLLQEPPQVAGQDRNKANCIGLGRRLLEGLQTCLVRRHEVCLYI